MFITHNYTHQHIMKLDTCGIERLPRDFFFFFFLWFFAKLTGLVHQTKQELI